MPDYAYWIWFSRLERLRFRTRRALLSQFGGARGLWEAKRGEIEGLSWLLPEERDALLHRDLAASEAIADRCAELKIRILCFDEPAYPERLRNIPDPPYVLYVRGNLPDVDREAVVAVVGTRRCTEYGKRTAKRISGELARSGAVVTTGLAAGIDSAAAVGCLDAGGVVLGVLGVAINHVYPRSNAALYDRVLERGALISEYPPDVKGSRSWFPLRNRIIAALSLGVVVAEAPLRSGALITAHRALDYGKDVFAVPSNADSPEGHGSNQLLREGAMLAECGRDILTEYAPLYPDRIRLAEQVHSADEDASEARAVPPDAAAFHRFREPNRKQNDPSDSGDDVLKEQLAALSQNQLKIVGAMDRADMHVDDIIDLTALPASVVLSELTVLQIKGYVRQKQGKRFTLNIDK